VQIYENCAEFPDRKENQKDGKHSFVLTKCGANLSLDKTTSFFRNDGERKNFVEQRFTFDHS
jgi:hypothetical protein